MSEDLQHQLRSHVEFLARAPRNGRTSPAHLQAGLDYAARHLTSSGWHVSSDTFTRRHVLGISDNANPWWPLGYFPTLTGTNLLAQWGETGPTTVIVAHIDTVGRSPGADDNASGVAAAITAGQIIAHSGTVHRTLIALGRPRGDRPSRIETTRPPAPRPTPRCCRRHLPGVDRLLRSHTRNPTPARPVPPAPPRPLTEQARPRRLHGRRVPQDITTTRHRLGRTRQPIRPGHAALPRSPPRRPPRARRDRLPAPACPPGPLRPRVLPRRRDPGHLCQRHPTATQPPLPPDSDRPDTLDYRRIAAATRATAAVAVDRARKTDG